MRYLHRVQSTFFVLCLLSSSTWLVAEEQQPALPQIGTEAYQLLTQFYDYDKTIPLEARTVQNHDFEDLAREKIVFRSTQGRLVPGYLQLPSTGKAPYPCVLLLHGWSGSKESWYVDGGYINGGNIRKALLERGYATFILDAQCHGDRIAINDYAPVNHYIDETQPVGQRRKGYFTQREIYVQTILDYRRGIDYLETRKDIDTNQIGVIGYSMGGNQTFMLTGVEPRIKAAVACATPSETKPFTIYAPQNFVHGIGDRPFFMVCGNNDSMCPVAHAEELFALLPSPTKQLKFYGGSHKLLPDFVPDAVDWITDHIND